MNKKFLTYSLLLGLLSNGVYSAEGDSNDGSGSSPQRIIPASMDSLSPQNVTPESVEYLIGKYWRPRMERPHLKALQRE